MQQQAQRRFLAPAGTFHLCESFEGYICPNFTQSPFPGLCFAQIPNSKYNNETTTKLYSFLNNLQELS